MLKLIIMSAKFESFDLGLHANEILRNAIQEKYETTKLSKASLASMLNIALGTLYKKLNGDSEFSLGEALFLCKELGIDFSHLTDQTSTKIVIDLPHLGSGVKSIMEYLENLEKLLLLAGRQKDLSIWYVTHELPIFYYFTDTNLGLFKLYTYARSVWEIDRFDYNTPYDPSAFDPEVIGKMKKLWSMYANLNTIEIWNTAILDNTYNQLMTVKDFALYTNEEDLRLILDGFKQVISKIENMIYSQSKNGTAENIRIYLNSMVFTNNIILLKSELLNLLITVHDNPNFFTSTDTRFLRRTKQWIDKLIKQSNCLTDSQATLGASFIRNIKDQWERFAVKLA